jgi:transposase-like protein
MPPSTNTVRDQNHRFRGAIVSRGFWLYYRFTLSYRDVQELLCERGVTMSHEAIWTWYKKF